MPSATYPNTTTTAASSHRASRKDAGLTMKERHEHRVSQHRAKSAVELEQLRERKQRKAFNRSLVKAGVPLPKRIPNVPRNIAEMDWDGVLSDDGCVDAGDETEHEESQPLTSRSREVSLVDLVSPYTRKPHRKNAEFEVLPSVPSVVPLEDLEPDVAINEPWEYIDFDDKPAPLSYAQIAAR